MILSSNDEYRIRRYGYKRIENIKRVLKEHKFYEICRCDIVERCGVFYLKPQNRKFHRSGEYLIGTGDCIVFLKD